MRHYCSTIWSRSLRFVVPFGMASALGNWCECSTPLHLGARFEGLRFEAANIWKYLELQFFFNLRRTQTTVLFFQHRGTGVNVQHLCTLLGLTWWSHFSMKSNSMTNGRIIIIQINNKIKRK